jgi:hypothetical protein
MWTFKKLVLSSTKQSLSWFMENYWFETGTIGSTEKEIEKFEPTIQQEILISMLKIINSIRLDHSYYNKALLWTIANIAWWRIRESLLTASNWILIEKKDNYNKFLEVTLNQWLFSFNPVSYLETKEPIFPSLFQFTPKFRANHLWLICNRSWKEYISRMQFINREVLNSYNSLPLIPSYIQSINYKLYHPYIFNMLYTDTLLTKLI